MVKVSISGADLSQQQQQLDETPVIVMARSAGTADDKSMGMRRELVEKEEQVQTWLVRGKIDAKHLAKLLPVTVQTLIDGNTTQDDIFDALKVLYAERTRYETVVGLLSRKTIPESWCRNEEQKQWLAQNLIEFQIDLFKSFRFPSIRLVREDAMLIYECTLNMPVALQETCKRWEQRVDQALFKSKKSPTFLFLCSTNKMSPDDFSDMVMAMFKSANDAETLDIENVHKRPRLAMLRRAIALVHERAHIALTTCWECDGDLLDAHVDRCSKCNIARYCCRECQVRAWKSGHRDMCDTLKKSYNNYLESLAEVDRCHGNRGVIVERLALNILVDYTIAAEMHMRSAFPVVTTNDGLELGVPRGPSMKYFYENVGRVLRREWWVYPTTVTLEEYNGRVKDELHQVFADYFFFTENICFFLAHDIFGFVAERSQESGMEAEALMGCLLKGPLIAVAEQDGMPLEKFMEMYNSEAIRFDEKNPDRSRNRSNSKISTFQRFRLAYHKKSSTA